ncbi:MAG: ParM/StbA family protein [Pseudomonadota bacterium]
MEVIGLDIGFGFTKATSGKKSMIFKSVYGEASDMQFKEQLLSEEAAEEHLQIDIAGTSYFAGELAERQSVERFFTLDQAQFVRDFTKVLALVPLSRMVARQEQIKLVAGLPVSHYRRHKTEIVDILKGQHEVTVVDAKGERTDTVVRVDSVRVVPQPFGALMDLMLNDLGEVTDKRFANEKVGVIDVGFRTTDYTIAERTRYSERGSKTIDLGMSKAFATIAAKLQESSGVNVELYRLYKAVDEGAIKIHGKRYDLKLITEHAFTQLATRVANEANRLWVNDWDIDKVIVTGGGGAVLAPFIQKIVKGEVVAIDPKVDSRLANVRGFHKYGKRLWTRGANPPTGR